MCANIAERSTKIRMNVKNVRIVIRLSLIHIYHIYDEQMFIALYIVYNQWRKSKCKNVCSEKFYEMNEKSREFRKQN